MQNQIHTFKGITYTTHKKDCGIFDCLLKIYITSTLKCETNNQQLDDNLNKILTTQLETEELINLLHAFKLISNGKSNQLRDQP